MCHDCFTHAPSRVICGRRSGRHSCAPESYPLNHFKIGEGWGDGGYLPFEFGIRLISFRPAYYSARVFGALALLKTACRFPARRMTTLETIYPVELPRGPSLSWRNGAIEWVFPGLVYILVQMLGNSRTRTYERSLHDAIAVSYYLGCSSPSTAARLFIACFFCCSRLRKSKCLLLLM